MSDAASFHETDVDELDERRLHAIAEQALRVRWQIVLMALVVASILWRSVPAPLVIGWAAAVIASRELRAAWIARAVRDRTTPIAKRLRTIVRYNFLIGVTFGSAALFMMQLDITSDALLTMILMALGAGAVSFSSTVIPAFLAYTTLIYVPTAIMWTLHGPWLGWGIAALVLLFFQVQIAFAKRLNKTFEESFLIRRENEALTRHLINEQAELARARDAAEQANREKSRFLAAASHDLRQPLQAITLNSGELARLPIDGDGRAIATDIQTSVEHLRSMLDGLLDLSKLDAGAVVAEPRRVRLDVLVSAVVSTFKAAAAARGIELRSACAHGIAVRTDPDLLRRMLANLVDNAIKFTPAGSVAIDVAERGDEVEVAVRDSGPGIDAKDHALIFEDLVRLPRDARAQTPGHGLGLGIVRRAAALLGLRIEVESARGQGAVFRFRLPCAPHEQEHDAGAAPTAPPCLSELRILLLDDDAMVRGAYATVLGGAGATARSAATIDDALPQIDACDAAVVDWRLADGADGFTAIERLRARRPDLPVVMVTADAAPSIADTARAHGVPLLRKPVDATMLTSAVANAIAAGIGAPASLPVDRALRSKEMR